MSAASWRAALLVTARCTSMWRTGFGELYLTTLGEGRSGLQLLSPRLALSNLYPRWSPDGRWLAYVSERGLGVRRELWLYDTESRSELRVPTAEKIGTALGWSADAAQILMSGANNGLSNCRRPRVGSNASDRA